MVHGHDVGVYAGKDSQNSTTVTTVPMPDTTIATARTTSKVLLTKPDQWLAPPPLPRSLPATFSASTAQKAVLVGLKLSLNDPDEFRKHAVVTLNNRALFRKSIPNAGGPNDPRLGSSSRQMPCKTCGETDKCQGHFGWIPLEYVCFNPLLMEDILKTVRGTCCDCSRPLLTHDDPRRAIAERLDPEERLSVFSRLGKTIAYCGYAPGLQPANMPKPPTAEDGPTAMLDFIHKWGCGARQPFYPSTAVVKDRLRFHCWYDPTPDSNLEIMIQQLKQKETEQQEAQALQELQLAMKVEADEHEQKQLIKAAIKTARQQADAAIAAKQNKKSCPQTVKEYQQWCDEAVLSRKLKLKEPPTKKQRVHFQQDTSKNNKSKQSSDNAQLDSDDDDEDASSAEEEDDEEEEEEGAEEEDIDEDEEEVDVDAEDDIGEDEDEEALDDEDVTMVDADADADADVDPDADVDDVDEADGAEPDEAEEEEVEQDDTAPADDDEEDEDGKPRAKGRKRKRDEDEIAGPLMDELERELKKKGRRLRHLRLMPPKDDTNMTVEMPRFSNKVVYDILKAIRREDWIAMGFSSPPHHMFLTFIPGPPAPLNAGANFSGTGNSRGDCDLARQVREIIGVNQQIAKAKITVRAQWLRENCMDIKNNADMKANSLPNIREGDAYYKAVTADANAGTSVKQQQEDDKDIDKAAEFLQLEERHNTWEDDIDWGAKNHKLSTPLLSKLQFECSAIIKAERPTPHTTHAMHATHVLTH